MPREIIEIPFTGGLEQKIAQKIAPPDGRLASMYNTRVNKVGAIYKDFGVASLADAATSDVKLAARGDQLLALTKDEAFTYDSQADAWASKGDYLRGRIELKSVVNPPVPNAVFTDDHLCSDVVLTSRYYVVVQGNRFYVIDKDTMTHVQSGVTVGANQVSPARLAYQTSSGNVFMFYVDSGNNLKVRILNPDASPTGAGTLYTVANDADATGPGLDCAPTVNKGVNAGAIVIYRENGTDDARIRMVNYTGTSVATAVDAATCGPSFGIAKDSWATLDRFHVVWGDTALNNFYCRAYGWNDTSMVAVSTATAIGSLVGASDGACSGVATATDKTRWFCDDSGNVRSVEVQIPGLGGNPLTLSIAINNTAIVGARLASRPFRYSGKNYIWIRETISPSVHLLMLDKGGTGQCLPVAKQNVNRANTHIEVVSGVVSPSSDVFTCALARSHTAWYGTGGDLLMYSAQLCEAALGILGGNSAEIANTTFIADFQLWLFDGINLVEAGFHTAPRQTDNAAVAGGNLNPAGGVYQFMVVYEWYDANGQVYRSVPSAIDTRNIVGASGNYQFTTDCVPLNHTNKSGVKIRIYRTVADGSTFHAAEVADNDPSAPSVAIVIGASAVFNDANLDENAAIYISGGVLDHVTPAGPRHLGVHSDRLFVITEDNFIYYTKARRDDYGMEFNDAQYILTDASAGRAALLGSVQGQLIIATERALYRLYGDGPNDAGTGGFSEPIRLSKAIGGTHGGQAIDWPGGFLFQSPKGLWNVGLDLGIVHLGASIEDAEDLPWGTFLHDTHDPVLWFVEGTNCYKFNYELKVWSNAPGYTHAVAASSEIYFANYSGNNGAVQRRDRTAFSSTQPIVFRTTWIRPGRINGFSRLKWIYLLGEYVSPHFLTVILEYENGATEVFTKTWAASDEPYVMRMKPANQKASAFRVFIQTSSPSGTYQSATFHALTLDVLTKTKYPLKAAKTL